MIKKIFLIVVTICLWSSISIAGHSNRVDPDNPNSYRDIESYASVESYRCFAEKLTDKYYNTGEIESFIANLSPDDLDFLRATKRKCDEIFPEGTEEFEDAGYDCSNAPHGSVNPGTCWGDSAYQCDSGRGRQDVYDEIQALSTAGTSGASGRPYSDGGKQAYKLYKEICEGEDAEVADYDCSNAPHGSIYPGTCWGDTAYQCDSRRARQDFYDEIQALSTAGTSGEYGTPYSDGGKQAYKLYKELCKLKESKSKDKRKRKKLTFK